LQKKNNVESVCDMYRHRTKKHKHFSFIIVIAFHSLSPLSTKKRWKKLIYRLFPVFRNISFFYCFWLLLFRITTTTKNKTSIYFFFCFCLDFDDDVIFIDTMSKIVSNILRRMSRNLISILKQLFVVVSTQRHVL
jgi:hypothetical protein